MSTSNVPQNPYLVGLTTGAERIKSLNQLLGKWEAVQSDVTDKINAAIDHGMTTDPWLVACQILMDCPASLAGVAELLVHETKQAARGDDVQRTTLKALGAWHIGDVGDAVPALIQLRQRNQQTVNGYLGLIGDRILECKRKLAADEVWATFPDLAEETEYARQKPGPGPAPSDEEVDGGSGSPGTIWWHGGRAYSTDRLNSVAVTGGIHQLFQLFFKKPGAKAHGELKDVVSNPTQVVTSLRNRYEGRFWKLVKKVPDRGGFLAIVKDAKGGN
jgi:hypothetical protein